MPRIYPAAMGTHARVILVWQGRREAAEIYTIIAIFSLSSADRLKTLKFSVYTANYHNYHNYHRFAASVVDAEMSWKVPKDFGYFGWVVGLRPWPSALWSLSLPLIQSTQRLWVVQSLAALVLSSMRGNRLFQKYRP